MPASLTESTRGLREPESPNPSSMTRAGGGSTGSIEPPRRPEPVVTRDRHATRLPSTPHGTYLEPEQETSRSPRRLESSVSIPEPLRSPSHISFGNEVDEDTVPEPYERQLGLILAHMSLSSPLIAMVLAFYSLLASLALLLLAPLSLCTSRPPLSQALYGALSPVLRFQMRLIVAEEPSIEDEKRRAPSARKAFLACVLAPLAAGCLLPVAWTVGVFWGFANIIGDPNTRSGREDEGRPAVRAVRRWWEGLLLWGVGA